MQCSQCKVQMVEGLVGKEPPFHLRFVPADHKVFVLEYAGVVAHACPKCGTVQLTLDPAALNATVKK